MKKYILSFLIVSTFAVYSVYQQMSGSSYVVSNDVATTTSTTFTPIKTSKPVATAVKTTKSALYKDGKYTGISADAYYGNIQVEATISGGKLTDVQFLDYPQDRGTSIRINTQAMPYLRQEAIQAQSANVNTVSGATDSSGAFRQSLASALAQAKNS